MSTVAPRPTSPYRGDPDYPSSDGEPLAESDLHLTLLIDLITTLRERLAADPMAYAGGDMLLYYEQGNKHKVVAPDIFVTLGVPKEPPRLNYIVWLEGKPPDVIIELTSKTTRSVDEGKKLALYRDVLKIPEYFLFDPTEDYLKPSLQGYRLTDGRYEPIDRIDGRLHCQTLGLDLGREGKMLRLYDSTTGVRLPTPGERADQENRRADRERTRANQERERANQERERANQERERANQERERAEEHRIRAEEQRIRAEQERNRAEQAVDENLRLMREIEKLRRQLGGS